MAEHYVDLGQFELHGRRRSWYQPALFCACPVSRLLSPSQAAEHLHRDASAPLARLAAEVGLSNTPCWRRIQRLKVAGVITRQVALLDPEMVNVGVTVIVSVLTSVHTEKWFSCLRATSKAIARGMSSSA